MKPHKQKKSVFWNSVALRAATCSLTVLFLFQALAASQLKLEFAEVAQSADLIFVGTVDRMETRFNPQGTFIITEVFFRDIMVIHSTQRSV
ncbi:MAG: hypothetical protein RB296_09070 [Acidobacteriota bacterium]|nr:hypothetical protein [Acidobacteriota bacterium]